MTADMEAKPRVKTQGVSILTWRYCKCQRTHQSVPDFLTCCLGHRPTFQGTGEYAFVEVQKVPYMDGHFRKRHTVINVTLYATAPEAAKKWKLTPGAPCGKNCVRHHLVKVVLPVTKQMDNEGGHQ